MAELYIIIFIYNLPPQQHELLHTFTYKPEEDGGGAVGGRAQCKVWNGINGMVLNT